MLKTENEAKMGGVDLWKGGLEPPTISQNLFFPGKLMRPCFGEFKRKYSYNDSFKRYIYTKIHNI
jgi:hypothetical protein